MQKQTQDFQVRVLQINEDCTLTPVENNGIALQVKGKASSDLKYLFKQNNAYKIQVQELSKRTRTIERTQQELRWLSRMITIQFMGRIVIDVFSEREQDFARYFSQDLDNQLLQLNCLQWFFNQIVKDEHLSKGIVFKAFISQDFAEAKLAAEKSCLMIKQLTSNSMWNQWINSFRQMKEPREQKKQFQSVLKDCQIQIQKIYKTIHFRQAALKNVRNYQMKDYSAFLQKDIKSFVIKLCQKFSWVSTVEVGLCSIICTTVLELSLNFKKLKRFLSSPNIIKRLQSSKENQNQQLKRQLDSIIQKTKQQQQEELECITRFRQEWRDLRSKCQRLLASNWDLLRKNMSAI